ncbi:hypothetical protein EPR50_G00017200 [Perca flavescens]|uniref:Uncharacterized protein n=1 Tax=Perca flavescens TaxID=8167 RepID=A0A484DLX8_PERFV|nr:hypothetical protein EPR50_G00017200 [Perca flavescens]
MLPKRPVVLMCCVFTSNLKLPLLFQADPTKVETVHDVLARAAAKGLLGGIIPEQSKTTKKGKSKKNRLASPSSKPSSPSSQERQTGRELVNGVAPSEHEEKKGECGEEGEEEDKGGKRGKKTRGLKGSKPKVKRRPKQTNRTTTVLKHYPKSHKKKSAKRKVNQSHLKRRLTKSKPRRIPRLTLTLMSSEKPSNHLSPITALAHKLSKNATITSQQTVFSTFSPASPAPPAAPHAASKQVQKHNTEPERAAKTLKDGAKPENLFKAGGKVIRPKIEVATEDVLKPADFVLPPISSPSSSSVSSRSGSSLCQRRSRTSHSQLAQTSASSSVSLPGLYKDHLH